MEVQSDSQIAPSAYPAMTQISQAVREVLETRAMEAALESAQVTTSISEHFASLDDPRKGGMVDHQLLDIITITVCAVICGANNWVEVALYAESKRVWLSRFLDLRHGIPSAIPALRD